MVTAGVVLLAFGVLAILLGVFVTTMKVLLWIGIGLVVVGVVLALVRRNSLPRS